MTKAQINARITVKEIRALLTVCDNRDRPISQMIGLSNGRFCATNGAALVILGDKPWDPWAGTISIPDGAFRPITKMNAKLEVHVAIVGKTVTLTCDGITITSPVSSFIYPMVDTLKKTMSIEGASPTCEEIRVNSVYMGILNRIYRGVWSVYVRGKLDPIVATADDMTKENGSKWTVLVMPVS